MCISHDSELATPGWFLLLLLSQWNTTDLLFFPLRPLYTLKGIDPKELLFMWVISVFTALEMNTEICKILTHFKVETIHSRSAKWRKCIHIYTHTPDSF